MKHPIQRPIAHKLYGMSAFIIGMFTVVLFASIIAIGNEEKVTRNIQEIFRLGGAWTLLCATLHTLHEKSAWSRVRSLTTGGIIAANSYLVIGVWLRVSPVTPPFSGVLGYAILTAAAFAIGFVGAAYYRVAVSPKPKQAVA